MKKIPLLAAVFSLISLSGCDTDSSQAVSAPAQTTAAQTTALQTSALPQTTTTTETTTETTAAETTAEAKPVQPITTAEQEIPVHQGEANGPEAAAEAYYSKTTFEFLSLEPVTIKETFVRYNAKLKQNGKPVEPDRYITLVYQNDKWEVVEEGY